MEKMLTQLVERMDVLIKLQTLVAFKNANQSERIVGLHEMGISQKDVATILGIPINTVTGVVSRNAKRKKKVSERGKVE